MNRQGIAMSYELTNTEVYNRWQQARDGKRVQAADYWYEFLSVRAKYGDKKAKQMVEHMGSIYNK